MEITTTESKQLDTSKDGEQWDTIITPRKSLFDLNLKELWRYRDLLTLFVRRNVVAEYKQTILGPLWYFIQPLLTSLIFIIIFGRVAGISTDGVPPMLFYLAGITNWNYFAECLNKTATTFKDNQNIFGKVYFPRLVIPFAIVATSLLKYIIQLFLFLGFYFYYMMKGNSIAPNSTIFLFPVLILILAGLGLGFGLIFTAMTTKYRDLVFLLAFGVQLAMYATPVIYPLSQIPVNYHYIIALNPMTSVIETFKFGFLGTGIFDWGNLIYSFSFMIILLLISVAVFNRTEKTFMDTV